MYSDIYSKLTPDERKVLETYHKKVSQSSATLPSPLSQSKSLKKFSSSKPQLSLPLKPSTKHSSVLKKSLPKSTSHRKPLRVHYHFEEIPDLTYEIEKLLRALYRHTVVCPSFKSEIKAIGGLSLLDEYLKYKDLNN